MPGHETAPPEAKITPDNPLFAVVRNAYQVIRYPAPQDHGVCRNCCMDPGIERDFFKPAIDALPLKYLSDWYEAAAIHVPKDVFAYLLPRIFEVLATGEAPASCGPEVVLRRYEVGDPERWTPDEWHTIAAFQRAFLWECRTPRVKHGDDFDDHTKVH